MQMTTKIPDSAQQNTHKNTNINNNANRKWKKTKSVIQDD